MRRNEHKGLHLHRVQPILFGGSPTDKDNIRFISRKQHAGLVVFWNKKIREVSGPAGRPETTVRPEAAARPEPAEAEKLFNSFPADYKAFLLGTNGLEGAAADGYFVFWSSKELFELNAAYQVKEFVADVILFGSDGAEEAFGFDTSVVPAAIIKMPFIGMGYLPNERLAGSFKEFLSLKMPSDKTNSPSPKGD